jgi:MerR family transcriptional regulator, copper efflux regulator
MGTTGYRIAEVAERSGYSRSTLRYYEQIGLLPPAKRNANGYRSYDGSVLERLGFITRAKTLGCTLAEISEMLPRWEAGECGPVQQQLGATIKVKLEEARSHIAELETLVDKLRGTAASLRQHTPVGACDSRCGCMVTAPPTAASKSPVSTPAAGPPDTPPIACGLAPGQVIDRLDEWQKLVDSAASLTTASSGVRITFDDSTPVETIARLAAAELACCSFFRFTLTLDRHGTVLEVGAPPEAADLLTVVFQEPPRR